MSIDMARAMMAEQDYGEGLDLDGVQLTAIDQALRLLTPAPGTYGGTNDLPRLAGVLPQSVGVGLLLAMTGFGTANPVRRDYKAGRFAENDDDCVDFWFRQRVSGAHGGWRNGDSGSYVNPELWVDVPCTANVTTLLLGIGVVEMQTATVATTITSQWVLGDGPEVYGEPSPRNLGGKLGPEIKRSNASGPGTVLIPHIRVVKPPGVKGESIKQTCAIRFRHDGEPVGNTLGTSWMIVARIPI